MYYALCFIGGFMFGVFVIAIFSHGHSDQLIDDAERWRKIQKEMGHDSK